MALETSGSYFGLYSPPSKNASLNAYWSADATFRFDNQTILNDAPGVFDTGSTLFGLATGKLLLQDNIHSHLTYILDAYNLYVGAIGAIRDEITGLLVINEVQYGKLQPLYVDIGDRTYVLSANAQIWPLALNYLIHGDKDYVYLIIYDLGPGAGVGFVAGLPFLERFYTVFDSHHHRVGLANTQFTDLMNIN